MRRQNLHECRRQPQACRTATFYVPPGYRAAEDLYNSSNQSCCRPANRPMSAQPLPDFIKASSDRCLEKNGLGLKQTEMCLEQLMLRPPLLKMAAIFFFFFFPMQAFLKGGVLMYICGKLGACTTISSIYLPYESNQLLLPSIHLLNYLPRHRCPKWQ